MAAFFSFDYPLNSLRAQITSGSSSFSSMSSWPTLNTANHLCYKAYSAEILFFGSFISIAFIISLASDVMVRHAFFLNESY